MSGREAFKRNKRSISFLFAMARIIPDILFVKIYDVASIFSGKIAILIRFLFLRRYSKVIGDAVYVGKFVVLKNLSKLEVGDNVSIHDFCYMDSIGGVSIGDNVSIAHGCSIVSFEHKWEDTSKAIKYNDVLLASVKIENDVWIGAGVRILSGSYIEERVVVASGAVVKGRLESGYIYAGIPARRIKRL